MIRAQALRNLSFTFLCLAAGLVPAQAVASARLIDGLGGPAGYGIHRMILNDDGSTCATFGGGTPGPIDVSSAFPMGLTFFGQTFTRLCLNNNGNIDFSETDEGVSTYTPQPFPVASQRMIAPWWGDVDTRNGSLADPDRDAVYWDVRPGQFTATWHNVGYFSIHDDQQNDFQLILRTFAGCGIGSFDVEFRFHRCEWVAGDASGGSGGHGGVSAQSGFDAGDSIHFFALPGSLTEEIVDLCETSNINDPGVWRFRIRGGELPCIGSGMQCDTGNPGACSAGTTECRTGRAVCIMDQGPSPERCDGVDNDCDGMPDNADDLCPTGFICDRGSCVPLCVEGGCFRGQTCVLNGACVDNGCLSVTCPEGQRCQSGQCLDACDGIVCPPPSICRAGGCQIPCDGVTCAAGMVCDMGRCQVSCMCRECPDNYGCSPDGTCQPRDCIGLSCAPGQVCVSAITNGDPTGLATCVDPCTGAVCPQGQHCESGRCIEGLPPVPDAGPEAGTDASTDASDGALSDARVDTGIRPRDATSDVADGGDGGSGSIDGGFMMGGGNGGCHCSVPAQQGPVSPWAIGLMGCAFGVVLMRRRRPRR